MNSAVSADLVAAIVEAMTETKARQATAGFAHVHHARHEPRRHQLCCFLKPSATAAHTSGTIDRVLDVVLSVFASHAAQIDDVHVLSGGYLRRHGVMAEHYGLLHRHARTAASLTPAMRGAFERAYGIPFDSADVAGGYEFLARHPALSARALDMIWGNVAHHRLATGCFSGMIRDGNDTTVVINGFTPHQLDTYTDSHNATVVFTVSCDLPWRHARIALLGRPDPAQAAPGSLRRELHDRRRELGLRNISLAANGAHMSAGPIEALVELRRFSSDLDRGEMRDLATLPFGGRILAELSPSEIEVALANPTVTYEQANLTIFDLTEDVDEAEAVRRLHVVRPQLIEGAHA